MKNANLIRFLIVILYMMAGLCMAADMVGLWEFDQVGARTNATVGNDLVVSGAGFSDVTGITGGDGAVEVAAGSYYKVLHDLPASGGGANVNRYTLMWDISYTAGSYGQYMCFLQTNPNNAGDGDVFINTSRKLGGNNGFGSYSENTTTSNTWYRVIVTVSNGVDRSIYVDGTLWLDGDAGVIDDVTSFVTNDYFLIFADDSNEDKPIRVSNVALWDDVIGTNLIDTLGNAGVPLRIKGTVVCFE